MIQEVTMSGTETYGQYSGTQLESLSHQGSSWKPLCEPCTNVIPKELKEYYKTLLAEFRGKK